MPGHLQASPFSQNIEEPPEQWHSLERSAVCFDGDLENHEDALIDLPRLSLSSEETKESQDEEGGEEKAQGNQVSTSRYLDLT